MSRLRLYPIQTPLSPFVLMEYQEALVALCSLQEAYAYHRKLEARVQDPILLKEGTSSLLLDAEKQLTEYFHGLRQQFSLPLAFYGTEFQKQVWQQLLQIPYGQTVTYAHIAETLGQKGARAVGTAVGRNPLPILVPCHRVLPASGRIGNFSLTGGAGSKKFLLDLEGAVYEK